MCAKFKVQQELFTREMRVRERERERERDHLLSTETMSREREREREREGEEKKKKNGRLSCFNFLPATRNLRILATLVYRLFSIEFVLLPSD